VFKFTPRGLETLAFDHPALVIQKIKMHGQGLDVIMGDALCSPQFELISDPLLLVLGGYLRILKRQGMRPPAQDVHLIPGGHLSADVFLTHGLATGKPTCHHQEADGHNHPMPFIA
jgi:hypothetical protein